MVGSELTYFSFWWILPIFMIILCFFNMRGRWGSMVCGCGPNVIDRQQTEKQDSARDILDRRYASGEIDKAEYEEKRKTLSGSADSEKNESNSSMDVFPLIK